MSRTWSSLLRDVDALSGDRVEIVREVLAIEREYVRDVQARHSPRRSGRFSRYSLRELDDNELVELVRSLLPSRRVVMNALTRVDASCLGPVADSYLTEVLGVWDISHAASTSVGRRRRVNEDAFIARPDLRLFAVVDGMGGLDRTGTEPATMCVDTVAEVFDGGGELAFEEVAGVVSLVNRAVTLACERLATSLGDTLTYRGCGATLAQLSFVGNLAVIAHLGDSRIYRFRRGQLARLTEDHSLANTQLKHGLISIEQVTNFPYRHVITRCLRGEARDEVSVSVAPCQSGDLYLLTTDGVTDQVTDRQLERLIADTAIADLPALSARLVEDLGGLDDNATAMFVYIGAGGPLP